jgi:small GTP-binding protein domain
MVIIALLANTYRRSTCVAFCTVPQRIYPIVFKQGTTTQRQSIRFFLNNYKHFGRKQKNIDMGTSSSIGRRERVREYSTSGTYTALGSMLDGHGDEETIYALSSGGGSAATAVAVIRITGPQSRLALQTLLSKSQQESYDHVPLPKPRYASLRMLYDPIVSSKKYKISQDEDIKEQVESIIGITRDPLDSSLVLLFNGPRSFTGEDMVEIHSHGSRAVVQGVLGALGKLALPPYNLNIRPAERGEFTQRAYGSGKLGLVEVEALADLIVADTSYQRLQALRQLDGRLSDLYEEWRGELIKGLAHAEAVIDFGDDEDLGDDDLGVEGTTESGEMGVWGAIRPRMKELARKMEKHLSDAQRGEILRDGVKVAIVGVPNAGKSSLLNLLADREAAIVSPIAGTTRDVVDVVLDLGGVRCIVSDTAGVREDGSTDDIIEVEGIKRARKAALDAHVLLCMVDSTDEENGIKAIKDILKDINTDMKSRKIIFVRNKIDLLGDLETKEANVDSDILSSLSISNTFEISCETNSGVDDLIDDLTRTSYERLNLSQDSDNNALSNEEDAVITRARHRRHVESAAEALRRFEVRSGEGYVALDMAAEELRLAASELGRITGAVDVEDVLDVLFSDFCIGK